MYLGNVMGDLGFGLVIFVTVLLVIVYITTVKSKKRYSWR